MGTQYRVVNHTKKEVYGFGLGNWYPKYTEAILNFQASRFLMFLCLVEFRGDNIAIVHEGNSWNWNTEFDYDGYEDKSEEVQTKFLVWESALNSSYANKEIN